MLLAWLVPTHFVIMASMKTQALAVILSLTGAVGFAAPEWDPFGPLWQAQWTPELEHEIDIRIEQYRKADYTRGGFTPGKTVEVEQVSHEFVFGANMFNYGQLGTPERNEAYRSVFAKLLNGATVAFYWGDLEPRQGFPRYEPESDADTEAFWNAFDFAHEDPYAHVEWRRPAPGPLLRFCQLAGVSVHGHAMIYHYCQPEWVYSMSNDVEAVRREYIRHVEELGRRYGGTVPQWDVVNESLNRASTKESPDDCGCWYDARRKVTLPPGYTQDAFYAAARAFPKSVRLAINDAWTNKNDAYASFIEKLLGEGVRIDLVGLQMHIFRAEHLLNVASGIPQITNGRSWFVKDVVDHLQQLDRFGKPIHISEITIPSPRGLMGLSQEEADEIQARVATAFYRLWFSWPSVNRITYWNLVDDCGAKNERMSSGWFNRDMTPKRIFVAMNELINNTWKTRMTVRADAQGRIRWRGFKGDYRFTERN